jgi:general secretion pathway protein G
MLRGVENFRGEPGKRVRENVRAVVRCGMPTANRERRVRLHRSAHGWVRGFTLMELMVVISMILILMSIALPLYQRSIVRARESVLRQDLFTLRSVISQYTLDKAKAPQGLDDLKTAGYIREIPVDPMTEQSNWEPTQEDAILAVDQTEPGISDVHSASSAIGSDGTAYNTW